MESNKVSRRERKKQETKDSILHAARYLFEKKGFENTSVEEITDQADVSKGTFFNHFTSKDSLLTGIAEEEVEDILFFAAEELSGCSGSIDKIRMILERLLEDSIPYLHLTGRVLVTSIINTGEMPSPFVKINDLLENLVKEGQKSGEITDKFTATDIATSLLGSLYGVMFKWFEFGGRPGTVGELDSLLKILCSGIKENNPK